MEEQDSGSYRQGLTLGLTMAEIFILILFLFLLMLSALYISNKRERREHSQLLALEESRAPIPEEIQELKRKNRSLEKDNTIAQELLESRNQELRYQKEINERLQASKEKFQEARDELQEERDELQEEHDKLQEALYNSKGVDPPCWYRVENRQGKRHERTHFLLDVAVHDGYLRPRIREAPPGRAIDEKDRSAPTSYAEEHAALPLAPLKKERNITLQEFAKITKPIQYLGKNKQIRDYPCVFHVKVWDLTSATAKERWKRAEDIIKQSFYTLRVRNDPWEQTNATH